MKSLKISITLLSMLAIVSFSSAQDAGKQTKADKIISQLNLDADQTAKVNALQAKYKPLIKGTENKEEKLKYRSELDVEVQKILTKEQYAKFKELKANEKKSTAARAERAKGAK